MTSKEWKKYKLGDICIINMGQSPKSEFYNSKGDGLPFLQGNRTFGFMYPDFDTYTTQITKTAEPMDVIMSVRAPVGELNIVLNKVCIGRGVCSIKIKNGQQKFLYYFMKHYISHLINQGNGTVFGSVNKNDISNLEVLLPPIETQEKIARVLSSLDDKIELNNKINQNLEQQAQAIYNQLILTQELKEKTLSEIIEITDGTHDSPKVKEEGYYLITSKHLSKYGVNKDNANYISEEDFNKINERSKVDKYDILISMIGTVGLVSLIIEDDIDFAVKNVGIFKTSLQKDYIYFIFSYLLSSSTQNYVKSHLAGTTQKYISLGELRNLKIKIPNEKILASFNNLVHPIYQKIIYNTNEKKILTQLRDTLLPKLMSGEIDVDKVEV